MFKNWSNDLYYEKYNDKCFSLRAHSKDRNKYENTLKKELSVRWNSRMKGGEGWLVKKENMKNGIGPQNLGAMGMSAKSKPCGSPLKKLEDLSGDGKVTQKDVLIGRGVIDG